MREPFPITFKMYPFAEKVGLLNLNLDTEVSKLLGMKQESQIYFNSMPFKRRPYLETLQLSFQKNTFQEKISLSPLYYENLKSQLGIVSKGKKSFKGISTHTHLHKCFSVS